VATGVVVRFDARRGYGFVGPDDGGEDVFVHQNNINMEGFRYLQVGERVSYELEVGEKGMKAVSVSLLEPRVPKPSRHEDFVRDGNGAQDHHQEPRRSERREYERAPRGRGESDDSYSEIESQLEKMRRKQERLISLLVAKGVLAPGEIDGVEAQAPAAQ
jgi:cold shock CspA family protein